MDQSALGVFSEQCAKDALAQTLLAVDQANIALAHRT